MRYVVCAPYAYRPYFDEFIKTVKIPAENMLLIDDTTPPGGIGIPKAHNMGIKFMKERGADWLIVMSAGIRFGGKGGLDFISAIEGNPDNIIINAAGRWVVDGKEQIIALGWHCSAFNKVIFEAVGGWDPGFTPYSLDDVDFTIRIQKHFGVHYKADTIECDFEHVDTAHSIKLGKVKGTYPPRDSYLQRKWGRNGAEWYKPAYDHPFNDPTKPLSYCPEPDDPLSIWQNEYKTGGWNFDDYNENGRTISGTPNYTPR